MTLGQGPEGGEGESHVDALEKSIPGREKSFRGLGTKESWVCLRSSGERREQGAGRPVGAGQPEGRAGSGSALEVTGRFRWGTQGQTCVFHEGPSVAVPRTGLRSTGAKAGRPVRRLVRRSR